MSHEGNTKLREEFMDTLQETTVCTYCGTETESPCCQENHHETAWLNDDGTLMHDDLEGAFVLWLQTKGD